MRRIGDIMVKQLSIFVQNEAGSLAKVTKVFKENQINIRAIATFDSPEFGILRTIVDQPEKAMQVLEENHFIVKLTNVLAIELEDKPGGLDTVLGVLAQQQLSINYIYSFVLRGVKEPLMIINLDDLEGATALLKKNGVKVVDAV